jgi:hypothetical protein
MVFRWKEEILMFVKRTEQIFSVKQIQYLKNEVQYMLSVLKRTCTIS